jgi:chromosome segregation ATPase
LRDEVLGLNGELRHAQESLQAVTIERDEASLHADSLSKSLEDERSEGQALNARIASISPKSCFAFWVWSFFLATA